MTTHWTALAEAAKDVMIPDDEPREWLLEFPDFVLEQLEGGVRGRAVCRNHDTRCTTFMASQNEYDRMYREGKNEGLFLGYVVATKAAREVVEAELNLR